MQTTSRFSWIACCGVNSLTTRQPKTITSNVTCISDNSTCFTVWKCSRLGFKIRFMVFIVEDVGHLRMCMKSSLITVLYWTSTNDACFSWLWCFQNVICITCAHSRLVTKRRQWCLFFITSFNTSSISIQFKIALKSFKNSFMAVSKDVSTRWTCGTNDKSCETSATSQLYDVPGAVQNEKESKGQEQYIQFK